jgi:hypothetical protein
MEKLIEEILEAPLKGLLIASAVGLTSLIIYAIKRIDDGKGVRWPTAVTLVILGMTTIVSAFLFFTPKPQRPSGTTKVHKSGTPSKQITQRATPKVGSATHPSPRQYQPRYLKTSVIV